MASAIVNILSGGLLEGLAKVIATIKGKNPEDAAKLEELKAKYEADFLLAQIEQRKLDLQELQMQADVNKIEAASSDRFVSGWRPFIGWVCGCGLAFQFIFRPLLIWGSGLFDVTVAIPELDMGTLVTLMVGMLGIGGMRTYEKSKGVTK